MIKNLDRFYEKQTAFTAVSFLFHINLKIPLSVLQKAF